MELGPSMNVDIGLGYEAGVHYNPGLFSIKLLEYNNPTYRSLQNRTFPMQDGITIGELLDAAITRNMHHYVFLPYTIEGRWKGCGDFMLQYWAVLVRAGIITSDESEENPNGALSSGLTVTYAPGNFQTYEPVGRGWWLTWNPIEDELAPGTVYSNNRPTYMLESAGNGNGN